MRAFPGKIDPVQEEGERTSRRPSAQRHGGRVCMAPILLARSSAPTRTEHLHSQILLRLESAQLAQRNLRHCFSIIRPWSVICLHSGPATRAGITRPKVHSNSAFRSFYVRYHKSELHGCEVAELHSPSGREASPGSEDWLSGIAGELLSELPLASQCS